MDPAPSPRPDPPVVVWHDRIDTRIVTGFVLLLLLISGALAFYLWTRGREALTAQSYRLHEAAGNAMVSRLEQRLIWAEGVVSTMADIAASEPFPVDAEHLRDIVHAILRQEGNERFVAGGGVWPEPGCFLPGVDRASVFWGRDRTGELVFYDDYNDPAGPGYHREEWYVPAKRLSGERVYWSKTYMDPYTFQPMVTCTAPMIRDGRFIGVATVDLKLEGIRELVAAMAERIHGYAFILDRNNTFVCYPDEREVQRVVVGDDGNSRRDFLTARDFAQEHAPFVPIVQAVERLDRRSMDQTRPGDDAGLVARALVLESDAIEASEALRIVAMFREQTRSGRGDTYLRERLTLADDMVFDESVAASIFFVPRMFWKVVTVAPESIVTLGATKMVRDSSVFALGLVFLAALATWAWIRVGVVSPLRRMTRKLQTVSASGDPSARLPQDGGVGELTLLAYWFNQRTQLLDEARQASDVANRSKSEFLANMSHEIRTPMTAILGYVDFLTGPQGSPEERLESAAVIRQNGEHLLQIINDILDLSKLESGRFEVERVQTDVVSIARGVHDLMSLRARERGIRLSVDFESRLPAHVRTDPLRVRQVLVNLLGNAIQFTDTGEVTLRVGWKERPNGQGVVTFEVTDTGVGIPPELMPQLFEPFTQGDLPLTRSYSGTGLGLSVSRRLARRLGGDITVTSTPGEGSTFSFTIDAGPPPFAAFAEPSVDLQSVVTASPVGPLPELLPVPARVLVADDVASTRSLLRTWLERAGAEVEEAANGRQALERTLTAAADGEPFDVVVMDMRMPEMDGYQATRSLRAGGYPGYVVACTAGMMSGDEQRCFAAGCDDFVGKPIDRDALIRKIVQQLTAVSSSSRLR